MASNVHTIMDSFITYLYKLSLPAYHQPQLHTYLPLYDQLVEKIDPPTQAIRRLAREDSRAKRLMTIPGIGPLVAMIIVAEIENIFRFPSYRNLASYAGLVPTPDTSAEKERSGRITKQGPPRLRTALIEAAHAIPRLKRCRLNIFFRKRIVRSGYKKTIVATAHKLLQFAFYILESQTPYQEIYSVAA